MDLIQTNIRDTSDRKRAEAAERESEERFRILVDGVEDYAILMTDPEGKVVSWNTGAKKILGYDDAEIVGRSAEILFTAEDRKRAEPAHELEVAVRDGRAEDERWHVRKDGMQFFASGVMTPLWHPDGSLRGFAKIMRDMTERKTNEVAMREAQKLESIGCWRAGSLTTLTICSPESLVMPVSRWRNCLGTPRQDEWWKTSSPGASARRT